MVACVDRSYRDDRRGAAVVLEEALGVWRTIVGREADWGHALISRGIERFGEDVMPEIWEEILRPLFERRYRKFDVSLARWNTELLPELLYVAIEAERTWLSTPDRDGAPIEIDELEDRWIMRFDPCGTGGRALRGDRVEGTPSRTQPPYGFPVIAGAYDWTDRMSGVCSYCNHCQVALEHWPMDSFGYPLRVVEPPLFPAETEQGKTVKCQWTMYKDPRDVPVEIYERSGRTKPTVIGSNPQRTLDHGGSMPARIEEC